MRKFLLLVIVSLVFSYVVSVQATPAKFYTFENAGAREKRMCQVEGPFKKAFKSVTGVTPEAFYKEWLGTLGK